MTSWWLRLTSGRWTRGQMVLRGLVLLLSQGALWLTRTSGVSPDPKLVILVLGLGVFAVLAPESTAGIVLLGVVVAWWGLAFRDLEHPGVIGAAACLLACHLCLTIAGYGPPSLPVSRPLVLLWIRRGVLVFLPVPALYFLALALRDQPAPPWMWATGMVAIAAAAVLAMLMAPQEIE
jgi:hypothetical protein